MPRAMRRPAVRRGRFGHDAEHRRAHDPRRRRDLARTIRAVGRVAYDERRVTHVHTKVQGWVEQPLRSTSSDRRSSAGSPCSRSTRPSWSPPRKSCCWPRATATPRRRAPSTTSPRRRSSRSTTATKRRLAALGRSRARHRELLEDGKGQTNAHALRTGLGRRDPTRRALRHGGQPNSNLYTIADLSRVWVLADVYEFELPWLALGQTGDGRAQLPAGERARARLTYISPFLDPKTRTAEVRLELDNAARAMLKPEMFGNTP